MIDETADEAAERLARTRDAVAELRDMATKWTPGPWEVGARKNGYARINGARFKPGEHMGMAKVVVEIDGEPYPSGECNARLIAAAPELYEALAEARLQIEYLHDKFQATGSGESVLAKIDATLKKARGE